MRFHVTLGLGALLLAGCQHASKPGDPADEFAPRPAGRVTPATPSRSQPSAPAPAPTPAPQGRFTAIQDHSGRVILLNAPLKYVVLEFFLTSMPEVDQRLGIYREGLKVGEVKVTGPARDRNIAADIVAGEAKVGDEVRDR